MITIPRVFDLNVSYSILFISFRVYLVCFIYVLIVTRYDMASFACLAPVTYLGGRAGSSKPRWLGWGVLLMGAGSLLFALPHFLVPPYRVAGDEPEDLCTLNKTVVSFYFKFNCPLQSYTMIETIMILYFQFFNPRPYKITEFSKTDQLLIALNF